MNKEALELYTDYLLSHTGFATATGLSAVVDGQVSHDKVTRFLSASLYTSQDLWQLVKPTVRQIERDDAVLIFDDTIQEKEWTDESELICWHFDHCSGRSVKGINLLNALYHCADVSIPVAFELVKKPLQFCDLATRKLKRASEVTKNEQMRSIIETCVAQKLKFRYVLMVCRTGELCVHHQEREALYRSIKGQPIDCPVSLGQGAGTLHASRCTAITGQTNRARLAQGL
jgi:DDE superfamily endonuclease